MSAAEPRSEFPDFAAPDFVDVRMVGGQIESVHRRSVDPAPADGLVIRPYDPTYYIAFTANLPVTLPERCSARVTKPDLDAADRALQAELAKVPEDQFEVIEMGETFADRIDVTCAPLP